MKTCEHCGMPARKGERLKMRVVNMAPDEYKVRQFTHRTCAAKLRQQ